MASDSTQTAFVDALANLYRTWLRISCLPAEQLVLAPAGGHVLPPEISAILAEHKTKAVADLIKRMPYIRGPPYTPELFRGTRLQDYWCGYQSALFWEKQLFRPDKSNVGGGPTLDSTVEPCELPLTQDPALGGNAVVIDSSTEELLVRIYSYNNGGCSIHTDSDTAFDVCSTVCKGRNPQVMTAVDLIHDYEKRYIDAEWMPDPSEWDKLVVLDWDIDWISRYHKALKECGWPDTLDCAKLKSIVDADGFYDDDFERDSDHSSN